MSFPYGALEIHPREGTLCCRHPEMRIGRLCSLLNVRTNFTAPEAYWRPLRELVQSGQLSMATIDSGVRDILRVEALVSRFDAACTSRNPPLPTRVSRPRTCCDCRIGARTNRSFLCSRTRMRLAAAKKNLQTCLAWQDRLPTSARLVVSLWPAETRLRDAVSGYPPQARPVSRSIHRRCSGY